MNREFEAKIDIFFEYLRKDIRLSGKNHTNKQFSQENILKDFSTLYRRYTIQNKDLGDFFNRETKDSLTQLCDDFERTLIKRYPNLEDGTNLSIAAKP